MHRMGWSVYVLVVAISALCYMRLSSLALYFSGKWKSCLQVGPSIIYIMEGVKHMNITCTTKSLFDPICGKLPFRDRKSVV